MSYLRGPDRSEVQLLPPCLDDYVAANAPARFIDAYVEGLDFAALGFSHARPKDTGRPPYHPADLREALPLWLPAPGAFQPPPGGRGAAPSRSGLVAARRAPGLQDHRRFPPGQPRRIQAAFQRLQPAVPLDGFVRG